MRVVRSNGSPITSRRELRTLVRSVGFTLQEAEVTEICRDQGAALSIPLQHAEDRHQFHDALEEARRTAVEAGSMEGVEEGTREGHVHFATFLHLIRGYLQSIKQKQIKREEAALRRGMSHVDHVTRVIHDSAVRVAYLS
eukprot:Skav233005  [mRNA]  locus=scaffold387:483625:492662:- [translate_table: standard]